jgi:hypothetical protein
VTREDGVGAAILMASKGQGVLSLLTLFYGEQHNHYPYIQMPHNSLHFAFAL